MRMRQIVRRPAKPLEAQRMCEARRVALDWRPNDAREGVGDDEKVASSRKDNRRDLLCLLVPSADRRGRHDTTALIDIPAENATEPECRPCRVTGARRPLGYIGDEAGSRGMPA